MHNISGLGFKNDENFNKNVAQKGINELFKNSGMRNNFVRKSAQGTKSSHSRKRQQEKVYQQNLGLM